MTRSLDAQLLDSSEHHAERFSDEYDGGRRRSNMLVHDLGTALDLLLKAIVASKHWMLVFQNPRDASVAGLREGRLQTISFREAREQVVRHGEVDLTLADVATLDQLETVWMSALHCVAPCVEEEELRALLLEAAALYLRLHETAFPTGGDAGLREQLGRACAREDAFMEARGRTVAKALAAATQPAAPYATCFTCHADSLVFADVGVFRTTSCLVCHCDIEVVRILEEYGGLAGACPACPTGLLGHITDDARFLKPRCIVCGHEVAEQDSAA